MSSINQKRDNESALLDISPPDKAIERRHVEGVAVTFSHSLAPSHNYWLFNESNGGILFARFDAGTPADTFGSGVAVGVPIGPLEKFPIFFTEGDSKTLKVIASGSVNVTLYEVP